MLSKETFFWGGGCFLFCVCFGSFVFLFLFGRFRVSGALHNSLTLPFCDFSLVFFSDFYVVSLCVCVCAFFVFFICSLLLGQDSQKQHKKERHDKRGKTKADTKTLIFRGLGVILGDSFGRRADKQSTRQKLEKDNYHPFIFFLALSLSLSLSLLLLLSFSNFSFVSFFSFLAFCSSSFCIIPSLLAFLALTQ